MRRFGLTYLPRVQAGMIYAADPVVTAEVCDHAQEYLRRRKETHFRSRLDEGRSEESCEWSMAMAVSSLDLPIFHWFQGQDSPQLDFIDGYVDHDLNFEVVRCRYHTDALIHGLRGFPNHLIRDTLVRYLSKLPGKGDFMWVTPYALHFGWMHHKQPFYDLSDRIWDELTHSQAATIRVSRKRSRKTKRSQTNPSQLLEIKCQTKAISSRLNSIQTSTPSVPRMRGLNNQMTAEAPGAILATFDISNVVLSVDQ